MNTLLPTIADRRIMTSIARIQNHEDFKQLKSWLSTDGKRHLIDMIVAKPNNNATECGAYQLVEALEELFNNSFDWAAKMNSQPGQKVSMIQEVIQ